MLPERVVRVRAKLVVAVDRAVVATPDGQAE
jgi:hypothetical protein